MRPQKPLPHDTSERIEKLLKSTTSLNEYRRLQSIYLRSKYGYNASKIARIVGLKPQTIRNIQSGYIKDGESALQVAKRGGRRKSHLTIEEEEAFLMAFDKEGRLGDIVEISRIHQEFEELVEQGVPRSTVSRLLHRHGWRKLEPRPKHPKSKQETLEKFKKKAFDRS